MKSLFAILYQEPVFVGEWTDREDVIFSFEDCSWRTSGRAEALEAYKDINILFAVYSCECYEGSAWVLYEENGKLYEVNGSHCSCYGLEGQWDGEEVVLEELKHRLLNGTFGESSYEGEFKMALCLFLGVDYVQNNKYSWI